MRHPPERRSGIFRPAWTISALAALGCCTALVYAMGERPLSPSVHSARSGQRLLPEPEALLVKGLIEIRQNRLNDALASIEGVLKSAPNFKLAHLIRGDLLLAHTRPLDTLGNAANAPHDKIEDLRAEAKARLARYRQETPPGLVPKYLLQLPPQQKYALVVDTAKSTLYVFENRSGELHYSADYYVSSGKNGTDKNREGDKKTPLGVYYVTGSLPKSALSDFYGSGAFSLSYPNEWDRRQGRNGHGIWLHGTPPDTYSRPPRASDGCVVLSNRDFDTLSVMLQAGATPVIISDGIEWVAQEKAGEARRRLLERIEQWRRDWESLDTEKYLRHYAQSFSARGEDLSAWARQKRQVNRAKSWVRVNVNNLGVLLYPGQGNLAVVTFEQDYRSSNLANRSDKRQYWMLENGDWKIVYEGTA